MKYPFYMQDLKGVIRQVRKATDAALKPRDIMKSFTHRRDFSWLEWNRSLAHQDCGIFYCARTGRELLNLSHLVRDDYDMEGSEAARVEFIRSHGQFWTLDEDELKENELPAGSWQPACVNWA